MDLREVWEGWDGCDVDTGVLEQCVTGELGPGEKKDFF